MSSSYAALAARSTGDVSIANHGTIILVRPLTTLACPGCRRSSTPTRCTSAAPWSSSRATWTRSPGHAAGRPGGGAVSREPPLVGVDYRGLELPDGRVILWPQSYVASRCARRVTDRHIGATP
jgi:hypothetical protein